MLAIAKLPLAAPVLVGAKRTSTLAELPAGMFSGRAGALGRPNAAEPVTVSAVTLKVALPVFVTVAESMAEELLGTLPNGSGNGLTVMLALAGTTPVPVRVILTVG